MRWKCAPQKKNENTFSRDHKWSIFIVCALALTLTPVIAINFDWGRIHIQCSGIMSNCLWNCLISLTSSLLKIRVRLENKMANEVIPCFGYDCNLSHADLVPFDCAWKIVCLLLGIFCSLISKFYWFGEKWEMEWFKSSAGICSLFLFVPKVSDDDKKRIKWACDLCLPWSGMQFM